MPLAVSLFAGFVLSLVPLPTGLDDFRPDWVAMLVLYWSLTSPRTFGVISAWSVGIVMDIFSGTLLGQHALGYILLAYMANTVAQQYPLYSILQQLFIVFVSLALYLALQMWITGIAGVNLDNDTLWYPILLSTLLWHWMSSMLNSINER